LPTTTRLQRKSGFWKHFRLVAAQSKCKPVAGFDDMPWSQLWSDFLVDASHFDYRKNMSLFGDPTPISKPSLDPDTWTEKHHRLIGEFVRQHHARLAHEIALGAFPGPATSESLIALPQGLSQIC
jgi:hypothetical protein